MAENRIKHSWYRVVSIILMVILIALAGVIAYEQIENPNSSSGAQPGDAGSMNMNTTSDPSKWVNQPPKPMHLVRHGNQVSIDMYSEETVVNIAPGMKFPAWTFDGTVPGPVINLQEGDHVTLTLHNLDPSMSHSIDLHSAMVAPNQAFVDVAPNKSKTITFDASTMGVFTYHCATDPMPLHMAQGMYGAVVITPKGEQPPTYTIVQSEFYKPNDVNSVVSEAPQYVVFNGSTTSLVDKPLTAKVGQPITIAFVNAGPNHFSAIHVVGTVLRDVQASGNPKNHLYDVQTYTVAPGDGALIHLQFDHAGTYTILSHSMSDMAKGAMGKVTVTN